MYDFFMNLCIALLITVMLMLTSYLMKGGRLWLFAGFFFSYVRHNKPGVYTFYCVMVLTVGLIRAWVPA